MKKVLILALAIVFGINLVDAQEVTKASEEKVKDKPVYEHFRAGTLIDNQTVFVPEKKNLRNGDPAQVQSDE